MIVILYKIILMLKLNWISIKDLIRNNIRLLNYITMTKRQRPQDLKDQLEADLREEQDKVQTKQQTNNSKSFFDKMAPKVFDFSSYKPINEKHLPTQFFRQEVVDLAKALLGKIFVRKIDRGIIRAVIVETEAYKAPLDKGCHAYNNKKTQRTKYFWLDGGHLYIYTIYMPTNVCLNVVAGNVDQPEAVLIRAVQPVDGIELVKELRKIKSNKLQDLCNGPGKVGQALGIEMAKMNGINLMDGEFKIVDGGINNFSMGVSRRVNIDYAQEWIDKPWRFYVQGNKFVSKVNLDASIKKKQSKSKPKKG